MTFKFKYLLSKPSYKMGQLLGHSRNLAVAVHQLSRVVPNFWQQSCLLVGFVNYSIYHVQQTAGGNKIAAAEIIKKFNRVMPPEMVNELILSLVSDAKPLALAELQKLFTFLGRHLSAASKEQLLKLLVFFTTQDNVLNDQEAEILESLASELVGPHTDFSLLLKEIAIGVTIIDKKSLYRILGIAPTASSSEIHKAYRQMAARFHPDRFMQQDSRQQQAAQEKFIEISKAYQHLK